MSTQPKCFPFLHYTDKERQGFGPTGGKVETQEERNKSTWYLFPPFCQTNALRNKSSVLVYVFVYNQQIMLLIFLFSWFTLGYGKRNLKCVTQVCGSIYPVSFMTKRAWAGRPICLCCSWDKELLIFCSSHFGCIITVYDNWWEWQTS